MSTNAPNTKIGTMDSDLLSYCKKKKKCHFLSVTQFHCTHCSVYCPFLLRIFNWVCLLPLHIQPLYRVWWEHPTGGGTPLRHPIHHHLPIWLGCYPDIPPVAHPWAGHMRARQSGTNVIQVYHSSSSKITNVNQCSADRLQSLKIFSDTVGYILF